MWGTPLSISNILYFLSRYTPFIDTTLNVICEPLFFLEIDACLISITSLRQARHLRRCQL